MIDRRTFLVSAVGATAVCTTTPHVAHSQEVLEIASPFGQMRSTLVTSKVTPSSANKLKGFAEVLTKGDDAAIALLSSTGDKPKISAKELSNQFLVFQLQKKNDGSPIVLESSSVDPILETVESTPDIAMDIKLLSFHLGEEENIDRASKATLRLTVNRAEESLRGGDFETLYWAVSAGLNLWDEAKNKKSDSPNIKSDFRKAFGNKYIEVPGGLGDIKFEVVAHKEPAWWRKVFQFGSSDTGRALVAALGFPAVTSQVLRFIDEAAGRLDNASPKVLFASNSLKFALSKQAREGFFSNGPTRIGALNPGLWLLARGRDFQNLANTPAYYYATFGKIVPASVSISDLLDPKYDDPFRNVTYAVLGVQMKPFKSDFSIG